MPPSDPGLMIRMLLVGYCFGIRSERRLCEEVHLNLAYRWFCRLGLEDRVPDHSTFSLNRHGWFRESGLLRDRAAAEQALTDFSANLLLVFEPIRLHEFQTLLNIRQPLHAVMAKDHPLAAREGLRLRECLQFPLALPTEEFGVRQLLEAAIRRTSLSFDPVVVSDSFEFLRSHAITENIISFQIPTGSRE